MADPNERPNDLNPQPLPPEPPERKGVSPLIWILLLLALLALGWWFFQQRGVMSTTPTDAAASAEPAITSEQEAAATAERERAEAVERERAERARAEATSPRPPADRGAEPIARLQPDYPREALRANEEGTVVLRVDVDAAGNVTDVGFASRSDSRELDRAAMTAVRDWKFRPAIQGGQPVASTVEVPIDFRLDQQ